MTNTISRNRIAAAELERITVELNEANADLALLERLKSAADRVKRLTAEQDKATKSRDKAVAAEAKAADDARFAGISDVQVTCNTPDEHVVRSSFTINYVRLTWNGYLTAPMEHSVTGFGCLPPDVLDYLIERRPDRIPAKIMALAPDSPREAFRRYFASLRRGHIIG
jgi:hypothetical protein